MTELQNAMRDNLGPDAIAMLVAYLQPAIGRRHPESLQAPVGEIEWFHDQLVELLQGGKHAGFGLDVPHTAPLHQSGPDQVLKAGRVSHRACHLVQCDVQLLSPEGGWIRHRSLCGLDVGCDHVPLGRMAGRREGQHIRLVVNGRWVEVGIDAGQDGLIARVGPPAQVGQDRSYGLGHLAAGKAEPGC